MVSERKALFTGYLVNNGAAEQKTNSKLPQTWQDCYFWLSSASNSEVPDHPGFFSLIVSATELCFLFNFQLFSAHKFIGRQQYEVIQYLLT